MTLLITAGAGLTLTLLIGSGALRAQSEHDDKVLEFDVVSIKPTPPSYDKTLMQHFPDGTSFRGAPVRMVLQAAFGVEDDRIIGGPSWLNSNRYDIQAKVAPEDAPRLDKLKDEDRRAMLIPLLTERFHLKYHHETRDRSTYALVVAKGGLRMAKGEAFPPGGVPPGGVRPADGGPVDPAKEHYKIMTVPGHIEADSMPMFVLADVLSRLLHRRVVDKTGLTANYNFTLRWTPNNPLRPMLDTYTSGSLEAGLAGTGNTTDAAPSSLFTALEEQLGLKLQSGKDSVDVIVIDHIDPPSPN